MWGDSVRPGRMHVGAPEKPHCTGPGAGPAARLEVRAEVHRGPKRSTPAVRSPKSRAPPIPSPSVMSGESDVIYANIGDWSKTGKDYSKTGKDYNKSGKDYPAYDGIQTVPENIYDVPEHVPAVPERDYPVDLPDDGGAAGVDGREGVVLGLLNESNMSFVSASDSAGTKVLNND